MENGQLLVDALFQPLPGFMVLAVGAMPIAAATVNQMILAAIFALIKCCAEEIRTAIGDGSDNPAMFAGHGIPETSDIFGTMDAHDVFKRCHGQILSSCR